MPYMPVVLQTMNKNLKSLFYFSFAHRNMKEELFRKPCFIICVEIKNNFV
jgi:hypothetical protein